MAQLNITLDQDEILALLAQDSSNAFRTLLQEALNAVLRAESANQLRAEPYQRTEERTDVRNGVRARPLTTRLGDIVLNVPRHRDVPFKTLVFENYRRSEAALITTMAEMVLAGVSTAKVGRVMEEICGRSFSKQAVSEACRELDAPVRAFVDRPIEKRYLFVMADATYLKVRENHRITSKALMIAIGLDCSGMKEVIGFSLEDSETEATWTAFLSSLRSRGLSGMAMLTSDAHEGLVFALGKVFPGVPWQRCQAHFTRNICALAPKNLREGLRCELVEMFNAPTLAQARGKRDEIMADYGEEAPRAMECLDEGFDDAMSVMELPAEMRRCTRTSNYLERLNREVKRRAKVIGIFPNAGSALRLMGAYLIEENERWALKSRIYYKPAVLLLEDALPRLKEIAENQRKMRLAA